MCKMPYVLPGALLNLSTWDQLSLENCERVAYLVAEQLPSPFRLIQVKQYAAGGQKRYIASFEWNELSQSTSTIFALIPGGTVPLGFDRTRLSSLVPMKSWCASGRTITSIFIAMKLLSMERWYVIFYRLTMKLSLPRLIACSFHIGQ